MRNAKVRIGYFDDSSKFGGTTRYLLDLIKGLDRAAFEPVFFSPAFREWHEELRKLDVKIVGVTAAPEPVAPVIQQSPTLPRRFSFPKPIAWHLGLAKELKRLHALFVSEPVDLYHSDNVGAEPAPIAAQWTGKPVIGTLHVDPSYDLDGSHSSFRYRKLEKWCFKSLDAALAVSQRTGEAWAQRCGIGEGYIADRMRVIYNGIGPSRLKRTKDPAAARRCMGLPADAIVIASLGRLEPAKGYEDLVRALALVIQEIPQVHVLIGGAGILHDPLLALARSLCVQGHFHLLGFISEIAQVFEVADVYVQPSLCEALPYGLLEAAEFGLPAVVTGVGGMPEIVESGENGLVVPTHDPNELGKAICLLAKSFDLRIQFGRAGAELVRKRFSIGKMCEQTMDVYRRLYNGEALAQL